MIVQMSQVNTLRPSASTPNTPDPYSPHVNGHGHHSNYLPSTPSSERRQRKTLLIQKQRQQLQKNQSSGGVSGSQMDASETSSSHVSIMPIGSNSSSTSTGVRHVFRSSSSRASVGANGTNSSGRFPPRMRRFVSVMGMAAAFCLLVMLREQAVSQSNKVFQLGKQQEQEQEHHNVNKQGHIRDNDNNNNNQDNKNNKSASTASKAAKQDDTPPSTSTNPMKALGGLMGWTTNTNKNKHSSEDIPYKSPIDDHPESNLPFLTTDQDQEDDASQEEEDQEQEEQTTTETDLTQQEKPQQGQNQQQTAATFQKQSSKFAGQRLPPPPVQTVSYTKIPYDPSMALQDPQLPTDISNNNSFVRQYCDLQGADWFPIDKELARNSTLQNMPHSKIRSWHQRAPAALLLGPSHGGSDLLFQLLASHPQVANIMRSHFFTNNYKRFVRIKPAASTTNAAKNSTTTTSNTVKVKARPARMFYMAGHVSTQRQLQRNPSQVVMDNVRETLLYEQIMAPFVLCTMPWAKLVITVQHPIKRLLKHYKAAKARGLQMNLEDWIARDLERMQQAGLILQPPQNTTAKEFEQQAKQTLANHDFWIQYQQLTKHSMEASAGQSLYEAMIHPWFTWMELMGRNPSTEIILVQREVLTASEESLQEEYQRIVKQLGLMPHTPPAALVQSIIDQQRTEEMETTTGADADQEEQAVRKQLQRFFQPYNAIFDQFIQSVYPDEANRRWRPELWKGY